MERYAEREDVGPVVGLTSFELFGRHVVEGAEDHSNAGERSRLGD